MPLLFSCRWNGAFVSPCSGLISPLALLSTSLWCLSFCQLNPVHEGAFVEDWKENTLQILALPLLVSAPGLSQLQQDPSSSVPGQSDSSSFQQVCHGRLLILWLGNLHFPEGTGLMPAFLASWRALLSATQCLSWKKLIKLLQLINHCYSHLPFSLYLFCIFPFL